MIKRTHPREAWKRINSVAIGMRDRGRLKMGPGNLMWAVLNVTTDEQLEHWGTTIVDLAEKIDYFLELEAKGKNKGQTKRG